MSSRLEKHSIKDTYQMILNEYFSKFLESEICRLEKNHFVNDNGSAINFDKQLNYNLFTGVLVINRVFEYVFLKSKSISSTYYYSSEAYSYYLEYMEQIYKANLLNNFNHADAILFVYKKTIFEMFECNETTTVELGGRSILSNILGSNKDNTNLFQISDAEFKQLFLLMTKTVNLLLCWKDPLLNLSNENESHEVRIDFCQHFLENFMNNLDKSGWLIDCLEIIYQHLLWSNKLWKIFLDELLIEISKRNKKIGNEQVSDFLLLFTMDKLSLQEKINNNDVNFLLKWCKESIRFP